MPGGAVPDRTLAKVLGLLVGLPLVACRGAVVHELPQVDVTRFQSVVLAERMSAGGLALQALPFSPSSAAHVASADGARLYLLLYDETLLQLFIDFPGVIDEPAAGALSRPIWPFDRGFVSEAGDGGLSDWVELEPGVLPVELSLRQVPAPDAERCHEGGGCYADQLAASQHGCLAPCPPASPIAAPLRAQLPDWVCPPDWVQIPDASLSEVHSCAPPEALGPSCAAHEVRWLGSAECTPIGPACPIAPNFWASDLIPPVIYVRAGAAAGGNGGRARPFGSISEAISSTTAQRANPTIALSAGHYPGPWSLPTARLVGACVQGTIIDIDSGVPTASHMLTVGNTISATIANLSIRPSPVRLRAGVVVEGGGRAHLSNVMIGGLAEIGVGAADGAALSARHLVVRGMSDLGLSLDAGRGSLEDVVVEGTERHGVQCVGCSVSLLRVAVRNSLASGLVIARAGTILARELLIDRTSGFGVWMGENSSARLEDTLIRDTHTVDIASPDFGKLGMGLAAFDANVSLERVGIELSHTAGIDAQNATLTMRDVLVRGVDRALEPSEDYNGPGVRLLDNVRVDSDRLFVSRTATELLYVPHSTVGRRSALGQLRNTTGADSGRAVWGSFGINIASEESIELTQTRIMNATQGIFVDRGAHVRVSDLTIEGAELAFFVQGQLDAERVGLDEVTSGACFQPLASGSLQDLSLRLRKRNDDAFLDQRCGANLASSENALLADADARLELTRFRIEAGPTLQQSEPTGTGLFIGGPNALRAQDGSIKGQRIGARLLSGVAPESALVRVQYEGNRFDWVEP